MGIRVTRFRHTDTHVRSRKLEWSFDRCFRVEMMPVVRVMIPVGRVTEFPEWWLPFWHSNQIHDWIWMLACLQYAMRASKTSQCKELWRASEAANCFGKVRFSVEATVFCCLEIFVLRLIPIPKKVMLLLLWKRSEEKNPPTFAINNIRINCVRNLNCGMNSRKNELATNELVPQESFTISFLQNTSRRPDANDVHRPRS